MVFLTHDAIDVPAVTEHVQSHRAGAVVVFLGTVREMTHGRQTVALDYEAYPEMALRKMQELEDAARQRWPLVGLEIVHRLGRLELGDVSICIAVSSPHRRDAFEAGQYLIDQFKEVVPIWKKENWIDGTTEWVHPTRAGDERPSK